MPSFFNWVSTQPTGPLYSNPSSTTQQTSAGANVAYPTLVPTAPVGQGVGLPTAPTNIPTGGLFSDQMIRGAVSINPAFAASFITLSGKLSPWPGDNEPLAVPSKAAQTYMASYNSPNYWKSRPAPQMSNAMLFGNGKPQKPLRYPWAKQFIPPLALFNDASQWVNRLFFNQPLTKWGWNSSIFPLMPAGLGAIYPPIQTQNLAAGTLNLQLQLGMMRNQTQALTVLASNYFGGG